MAQVREFELLHGVVLTKLLRTNGAALRLVETDSKMAWAAYLVNDAVNVYVKYRLQNRATKKEQKLVWSFVFSDEELYKIAELRAVNPVWLALVCGLPKIESESLKAMQVCLLDPKQIDKCIDVGSGNCQVLTVEYKRGLSLRAFGPRNSEEKQKLVVPRNRLDEWTVPGS